MLTLLFSGGGDLETLIQMLVNIGRRDVIDSICDPVRGKSGIDQLEVWMQEIVGMTGNLFSHDFRSTNMEEPDNLVKLLAYCKIKLPKEYGKG